MLHSRAWADDAWREAQPWVAPTSLSLRSGQHVVYGVRLLLASGPQEVRRGAGRGATKQGSSHHHMSRLRMHHYQGIAPQLNWNWRVPHAVLTRKVEATLLAAGHPVVVGIPGFVVHADMTESRLMVRLPRGASLVGTSQEPQGALRRVV